MFTRRQRITLIKIFSLFSVVRGYNVFVIVLAQYLAAVFILASDLPVRQVLLDGNLMALVAASALAIASGYIVNAFYDAEKDLINRPNKTMLDRKVSQRFKLTTYFILNFLSVICASYVSFRAVIFFSLYILGIWMYSHKLKRIPLLGNIVSALLAITPFFAVFVYYRNFDTVVFVHALYLFLIILIREFVKDLENLKGDLLVGYQTLPVYYGERISKWMITFLVLLTLIPATLLVRTFNLGSMYFYFYGSILALILFLFLLWRSSEKVQYLILHNILKGIIVAGVISILLIDPSVVLNRIF